jgi:aspartate/methionine/tyrosine aminotransferase
MEEASFRELHRIADHQGIIVFSDEVYRELEYDSATRLPAACELSPSSVSLGVTSKAYGLPGLRIGWIATHNRGVYDRVASLKDYTTICNSAPSEFLAEVALRHRVKLVQRNVAIIEHNLAKLDLFFARHSELFSWQRPRAGPIAFPRWLGGDVDEFCDQAIHQAGILLAPGTLFDYPWNHFRLGFGRQSLPVALDRLEKFIDRVGA